MKSIKSPFGAFNLNIRTIFSSVLFYLIFVFFFMMVLIVLVSAFVPLNGISPMASMFVNQGVFLASTLFITYLYMGLVDREPFSALGFSIKGRWKDIAFGALTAIAIYAVGFGVSLACGFVKIGSVQLDVKSLLVSMLLYMMVSLNEEVLIRGYVLRRMLKTERRRFMALVYSAILFSAAHAFNAGLTYFCLLNLFIAGLMLGVCYIYTRNLWFSLSLHLFWNWIQGPLLGYDVSGTPGDSLITLSFPNAESVFSGARFGFEGTPQCTILMIAFIVLAVRYFGKSRIES